MSAFDDYDDEMFPRRSLDDDTIEDLLAARDCGQADLALLADFVNDVRVSARGPAPVVSSQLAALLAGGLEPERSDEVAAGPSKWQRKRPAIARSLTGLSVRAKAALGLGVAAVVVTGAGAAGALPGPVQHVVAVTVGAVTPFDLPDATSSHRDVSGPTSGDAKVAGEVQRAVESRPNESTAPDTALPVTGDAPAVGDAPVSVPENAHSSQSSDVGSKSPASPNDSGSQREDVPDDPGAPHAKVPDDPGAPHAKVRDGSGAPHAKVPDGPGAPHAKVPDDPGARPPGPPATASAAHDVVRSP